MSIKKQYIPAPLASAVKGGYVTDASEILDENKGKRQDEINQETDNAILAEKNRAMGEEGLLRQAYEALSQSNIVVVEDHNTVESPVETAIYREFGTNTYSDWMYQNDWHKMAEYDNATDDIIENTNNIVKNKAVYNVLKNPYKFKLEAGTINSSGVPVSNNTRSRTKDFVEIIVPIVSVRLIVNNVEESAILRYYSDNSTESYLGDTYTNEAKYFKFTYADTEKENVVLIVNNEYNYTIGENINFDEDKVKDSYSLVRNKAVYNTIKNPYYFELESGTINSSGVPVANNDRSRTKNFISIESPIENVNLFVDNVETDVLMRYYRTKDDSSYLGDEYTQYAKFLKFVYYGTDRENVVLVIDGVKYDNVHEITDFASKDYAEKIGQEIFDTSIVRIDEDITEIRHDEATRSERSNNLLNSDNANVVGAYCGSPSLGLQASVHAKTVIIPISPSGESNIISVSRKVKGRRFAIALSSEENPVPGDGVAFISATSDDTGNSLTLRLTSACKSICVYYYNDTIDVIDEKDILRGLMVNYGNPQEFVPYYVPLGYSKGATAYDEVERKVNIPFEGGTPQYGNPGQVLHSGGDGNTYWGDDVDPEVIYEAVKDWLDDNPPAAVPEGSIERRHLKPDFAISIDNHFVTPQMFATQRGVDINDVGNGVHDDTDLIQDAINYAYAPDNNIRKVFIPYTPTGYKISRPLLLNPNKQRPSITISGVNIPNDTADSNAGIRGCTTICITDDFESVTIGEGEGAKIISSVFILFGYADINDSDFVEISNLYIQCRTRTNVDFRCDYGFYQYYTEGKNHSAICTFENIFMYQPIKCGFYLPSIYGCKMSNCKVTGGLVDPYNEGVYPGATKGFYIAHNNSEGMTSMFFERCQARRCKIGWDIGDLAYSVFNACAADNCYVSYKFDNTKEIAFNGCGCENQAMPMVIGSNCSISISGFSAQTIYDEDHYNNNDWAALDVDFTTFMLIKGDNNNISISGFSTAMAANQSSRNIKIKSTGSDNYISILDRSITSNTQVSGGNYHIQTYETVV